MGRKLGIPVGFSGYYEIFFSEFMFSTLESDGAAEGRNVRERGKI